MESGPNLRLAASFSAAGDRVGVRGRELLRYGAPGLHANLDSGIDEGLLVSQRNYGIDLCRAAGGEKGRCDGDNECQRNRN